MLARERPAMGQRVLFETAQCELVFPQLLTIRGHVDSAHFTAADETFHLFSPSPGKVTVWFDEAGSSSTDPRSSNHR